MFRLPPSMTLTATYFPSTPPFRSILELILFGVLRNGDVKPLAKALIDGCGGSLGAVLSAPAERLAKIPGCGEAVIAALKVTREAGLRLLKADAMQRPAIANWQALLDYCRADRKSTRLNSSH